MLNLPSSVTVVEVAPRDGLQSFPREVDTETKVRLIDRLSEAGFPLIEVTGFAHPKVIPNLRDAEAVCERIVRRPGTRYRGLAPNARGAERAIPCKLDEILGLVIASPMYLRKNQNMTLDVAIEQAIEAFHIADRNGVDYTVAVGMSFWCPYEGLIDRRRVLDVLARLHGAGIKRAYLAGSAGMEDPRHVNELFSIAGERFPALELGFHVHNLSGMGTANIIAALDGGASRIEGAICGIGGGIAMPSALGSVGNFPSEDLVTMLALMGVNPGVDVSAAQRAARDVAAMLEIEPRSHTGHGITREMVAQRNHEAMA